MIIKEIHESIAAQNVDGFGEVKFDYGTMRRVMNDILYESAEYARENVGNLLFHGNGHSDRMVKFIYDRHARHLDLIFVINGALIQRGDRHHIIDESDFRTFQRLHVDDRWGAFIYKVIELMERAVVESMLDGYLTEEDFFEPPVKYDFASKNESIIGTLRTLCAVSNSLKEAMENGGVNKQNMEIWMDEVVASVEALKEHTDIGY